MRFAGLRLRVRQRHVPVCSWSELVVRRIEVRTQGRGLEQVVVVGIDQLAVANGQKAEEH